MAASLHRKQGKQRPISSFFAPRRTNQAQNAAKPDLNNASQLTLRSGSSSSSLSRSGSFISKAFSTSGSEFDDISSSDTSFDTSMEVTNFRTPALSTTFKRQSQSFLQTTSSASIRDLNSQNSQASLQVKRSQLDLLDFASADMLSQPRKIAKVETVIVDADDDSTNDTTLSPEQQSVLRCVLEEKRNVFYTGSAGTGKSVVLRELVTRLKRVYQDKVGITASTGMAACNIQGQTLHKFLGIGLGHGNAGELAARIKKNYQTLRKWQALKVLVIDEISMIDGELFDKLNNVAQILRNNTKKFGGIQVICTGDFFQLPPISKQGTAKYCFQASSWKVVMEKTILLTKVFRQQGDNELIRMLNALRYGSLDDDLSRKFLELQRPVRYDDGIEPTELFPTRAEVKSANTARLNQLKSPALVFKSKDNVVSADLKKQLDNLICDEVLVLKVGAQVMYLKNYSDTLVNGSIGTIKVFLTDRIWKKILEFYGYPDATDLQMMDELSLLSDRIGCTDDWTEQETRRFDRIPAARKTIFKKLCMIAAEDVKGEKLPVVNFKVEGADELFLVSREEFTIEHGKKFTRPGGEQVPEKLVREQLPLLLSWALSIHKAQGQTIDRLRIDLGKSFEKGQVYVALSRARNKDHLEIKNFSPHKVKVADVVKQFYHSIDSRTF